MIKFLLFALLTALPIIPQPAEVQMGSGTFDATNARCIIQDDVPELSAEFIGLFIRWTDPLVEKINSWLLKMNTTRKWQRTKRGEKVE